MDGEVKLLLHTLRDSYGPTGRAHTAKPSGESCGAPSGVVTSRGYVLLKWFPVSALQLKVAVGALMNMAAENRDCGKFGSLLALRILRSCLSETSPLHARHMQASIVHHVLSKAVDYLDWEDCPCRRPLDHSSMETLLTFVQSVLGTCASCCWTKDTLRHVSHLTVKAFAVTLPGDLRSSSFGHEALRTLGVAGQPVSESQLMKGILVEAPDTLPRDFSVEEIPRRGRNGEIVTAVFSVSLAGDVEGIATEEQFTALSLSPESGCKGSGGFERAELERLLSAARTLVDRGVGFVGCQKVVHPLVKEQLRRKGVVVVDRLSLQHIGSVVEVTGGEALTTHTLGLSSGSFGQLREVGLVTLGRKRYLQLVGYDVPHHSLVLCAAMETQLNDMQDGCTAAVHLLRESLSTPVVLCGGGCTETVLANHVHQQLVAGVDKETLDHLKCTHSQYVKVCRMIGGHIEDISASLEHHKGMTLVDCTHSHAWSLPPWEFMEPLCEAVESPNNPRPGGMLALSKFLPQTCNCGLICAKDLSSDTVWRSVGGTKLQYCLSNVDTVSASSTIARSPGVVMSRESTARLCVMDSFVAKRQTLLAVANLLSHLIMVDDVI